MAFSAYYAYAGAALLMLELFHFSRQRKLYDQRTKLFFAMLAAALLICLGSIGLTIQIMAGRTASPAAQLIAVITYLAQFAMPYLMLRMSCLSARRPDHMTVRIGTVSFFCGCLVILSNPWTCVISYPGVDNLLHVGSGYPVFVWGILVLYLFDIFIVIYQGKNMKYRQCSALAEACILMMLGMMLQNVFHMMLAVGFAAALAMAVIYLTMQNPYAYIDLTTQVFNGDYFDHWIWECSDSKKETFLLVVKLSELERIRRLYGADVEISRRVAEKLWNIAPGHCVFRLRFDKYVILSSSEKEHRQTLSRLQELFSKEIELSGHMLHCSVILVSLEHAEKVCSGSEMMNYIRFLLRQEKHENGVQLIEGTPQQKEQFLYEQKVEQYLNEAMENDSFEVWYQPIYSVSEKRFVGMEALSRLYSPELGWINPELFIRLAVKNGQIFTLMPRQLHKVCRFLRAHTLELSGIENIKINLSPAELVKDGYCEQLIEIIRTYDLPTNRFQFEVTETDATEYTKELKQCIQILKENGIRLCLDDFGSGYANLSNILRLPFSVIKMDRSLLQGICENENNAAFYRGMVDTLHDIGYQIVSEGVEMEQEASLLAEWKVDMIQGYYYAKPQPEEEVLAACKAEQNI